MDRYPTPHMSAAIQASSDAGPVAWVIEQALVGALSREAKRRILESFSGSEIPSIPAHVQVSLSCAYRIPCLVNASVP